MRRFLVSLIFFIAFFALFSVKSNFQVFATSCKDAYPSIPPVLISAVSGDQSVTLSWTQESEPFTHYLVAYSRSETNIEFGNPNIGGSNTRQYTVRNLTNGVKYYFWIKPINGCKPGNFSNKLSAVAGGYQKAADAPNLSLYKTGSESTSSAHYSQKGAKPHVLGAATQKAPQPVYFTWQLLLLEAFLIVSYFILTSRTLPLSKAFGVLIPISIYGAYLALNKSCVLGNFFCKYFVQLDILIFIGAVVFFKLFIWNTPVKEEHYS